MESELFSIFRAQLEPIPSYLCRVTSLSEDIYKYSEPDC